MSEDCKALQAAIAASPVSDPATRSPVFCDAVIAAYGEKLGGIKGILHEIAKMTAWLAAKRGRKYKVWGRFVNGWLERADPVETPGNNGHPKKLVANVPPGHPCAGHSAGQDWQVNGYAYRLTGEWRWNKRSLPDGQWGADWELVPFKEA